jgi:lipopolysaccharide export system permease protein
MFRGRTLRWYIAKRFITAIAGAFIVCAALIFMIDLIELLRQARNSKTLSMTSLMWIAALRLPSFSEILLPFAVLCGSIGALLSLSRKSELAVMRAGGMSVWQFLRPGLTVGLLVGAFSVAVYNPMATEARNESERIMAEAFGRDTNLLAKEGIGSWLRQDGADGPSVMNAKAVANQGLTLAGVIIFHYGRDERFLERIDAERAELSDGYWNITNAWITRPGREAEKFEVYTLSTFLTRERALDAFGAENSVSIHELPGLIEMAEKARLPVERFRVQYQLLLSRPLLLTAMVLLAATVSLRSFRMGGIQTMVVTGMVGGIGFFLITEVSRQAGLAGFLPAAVAIWMPVLLACLVSVTVLLHQEDG